jgi:outer membrane lipoprotein-sorting protein
MKRVIGFLATLAIAASTTAVQAGPILDEANAAFAKVNDYTATVTVHEVDGKNADDHVYAYAFKRPTSAKIDVLSGSNKGGGIVWTGGDKVKGHRGGILSGIHLTLDLHDKQVLSLRGDSIDTGTIPAMLDRFKQVKGDVTEGSGMTIDGVATDAVTLKVADSAADKGVTREVLYLSKTTHLPVRRDRFAGDTLVKSEVFTNLKTNVGLKDSDFPF